MFRGADSGGSPVAMPSTPLEPIQEGTPLELVAARPLEPLVRARGTMFIVTNREGNIGPAGARELGLFFNDTRYLSHYELGIEGGEVAYLSAESADDSNNQIDLMLGGGDASENRCSCWVFMAATTDGIVM